MVAKSQRRWMLGLILLAVVVFLWVASGFFVNAMGDEYRKPYFVTYLNTTLMTIYLPFGLVYHKAQPKQNPILVLETARLSAIFYVLWFCSNLLNNASYYYTTVHSATIISCSSSFFTLIFGAYMGVENFTLKKLGPLLIVAVGLYLISSQDNKEITAPPHALLGNLMALGSACLYGVYTTLLKLKVGDESRLNSKLFFGFVGVFTTVTLWPLIWILHIYGIEPFELPHSTRILVLLFLNGVAIMVSDVCWVLSMLMTSPLLVSVGLSATIPLSMLGEVVIYHRYVSILYVIGAALVCYSVWVINKWEQTDSTGEEQEEEIAV